MHTLPDGGKVSLVSHEPNEETSGSSGRSSPNPILTTDVGSLTLAQFVGQIEARTGQVVRQMVARFRRRLYDMLVTAPQQNVDRFGGQGQQLVDDVAYGVAGLVLCLGTHGIIEIRVSYIGLTAGDIMNYRF